MSNDKKVSLQDSIIQIRILKALDKIKLVGPFKHFAMIGLLRGLKQPNILTPNLIWKYVNDECEIKEYEKDEFNWIEKNKCYFNEIFDE